MGMIQLFGDNDRELLRLNGVGGGLRPERATKFFCFFLTTGSACVFMSANLRKGVKRGQKRDGSKRVLHQLVLVLLLLRIGLPAA
jgi:hypothetical protein